MEDGSPILIGMLDSINGLLVEIDECFAANDINNATKKTHECLLLVKEYKDCLNEPVDN